MKCLSIRQPWAWAIINGGKDIENRTWSTKFRGRFLVHASQGFDRDGFMFMFSNLDRLGLTSLPLYFEQGGLIGTIELIDCVETSKSVWFEGPYGFVLKNPKIIEFKTCKGHLGFFDLVI
jgi:hypothetical protein